ncbi:hypothetical protein [Thiolapillus sp.]|uniref:hypothetical protein n=1 Tax=Thiolapillus sp. TaxID=2017437 RepID=UPI003AF9784B
MQQRQLNALVSGRQLDDIGYLRHRYPFPELTVFVDEHFLVKFIETDLQQDTRLGPARRAGFQCLSSKAFVCPISPEKSPFSRMAKVRTWRILPTAR